MAIDWKRSYSARAFTTGVCSSADFDCASQSAGGWAFAVLWRCLWLGMVQPEINKMAFRFGVRKSIRLYLVLEPPA